MNFKQNKKNSFKQKIISIPILIIILFNIFIPKYVFAADLMGSIGKSIVEGLVDLVLFIPDSIMYFLEDNFAEHDSNWKTEYMIIKTDEVDEAGLDLLNNGPWYLKWAGGAAIAINHIPIASGVLNGVIGFATGSSTETTVVSNITYSPKYIFSNKVAFLNANFFSASGNKDSIAYQIRNVIATWYYALRNIALVFMLIILVFVGIKITVSSVAEDKAKYKQLLIDWVVGVLLVIFAHYIMIFAVNVIESLSSMLASVGGSEKDTLINLARTSAGYNGDKQDLYQKFLWAIMYLVIVFYSLIFTVQYIKRVIKLAFLTLFAPIIAATYPIDKMMDGKAQGFEKWLKDYMYTLLIQPLHLIIYTVLISSVQTFAETNMLYAVVAMGFMMPMERMLREFLGFNRGNIKGPNPAGLLTVATLGSKAMNMLLPSNVRGKGGSSGSNGGVIEGANNKGTSSINMRKGTNPIELMGMGAEDNKKTKNNELPTRKPNTSIPKSSIPKVTSPKQLKGRDKLDYAKIRANYAAQNTANRLKNTKAIRGISNFAKNTGNGLGAVGRRYSRKLSKVDGGKLAFKALKTGAGVLGAAAVGSAGLAYGITAGDPTKAAELALGGAAGGYALGSKTGEAAGGLISRGAEEISENSDAFRSGFNPEKYEDKLKKKQEKEEYKDLLANEALIRKIRTIDSNINMNGIKSTINSYVEQGITDSKKIETGVKLEKEAGVSRNQAVAAIKLSEKYKNSMDNDKENKVKRALENQYQGHSKDPKDSATKTIDLMKMANGDIPMRKIKFK